MESEIRIRATVPEMNAFFEENGRVRYMKLSDRRFTEEDLERMTEEEFLSTKFLFHVLLRHRELEKELTGTFTMAGLKKKLMEAPSEKD